MRIYIAIFIATLSTVVVPVPEEATLLTAGYAVRWDHASLLGCVGAAWAAVMIGDAFAYVVGRAFLSRILRTRWGEQMLPRERRVWAERIVAARGTRAIVIGRFLVGLRGFVYFAVGASRYPFARFLATDALAAAVEVGGVVAIGFAFGGLRVRGGRGVDVVAAAILVAALFGPTLVRAIVRNARSCPK